MNTRLLKTHAKRHERSLKMKLHAGHRELPRSQVVQKAAKRERLQQQSRQREAKQEPKRHLEKIKNETEGAKSRQQEPHCLKEM